MTEPHETSTHPGIPKSPASTSEQAASRADYVYPVRSLLSGRIQRAVDPGSAYISRSDSNAPSDIPLPPQPREHRIHNPFRTYSQTPYWTKDHTDAGIRSTELLGEASSSRREDQAGRRSDSPERIVAPSARRRRRTKSDSQSLTDKSSIRRSTRAERPGLKNNSPNFRHFPAEDYGELYGSRSFSSGMAGLRGPSSPPLASMETITTGPSPVEHLIGPSNSFSATTAFEIEWSQLSTPPPNPNSTAVEPPSPSLKATTPPLPFNPSEYGLVHLPPLPPPLAPMPEVKEEGESDPFLIVDVLRF